MSLDDIRSRYSPQPSNLEAEIKRLRAENAQLKKDIAELLSIVDGTQRIAVETAVNPGEQEEIESQLQSAGLSAYVPQGPATLPRERENVQANVDSGRASVHFSTTKGIEMTAGFDPNL